MRLTDILSGADLDLFASVSLGIFLLVFVAIVARVVLMPKGTARHAAHLPLEDTAPAPTSEEPADG